MKKLILIVIIFSLFLGVLFWKFSPKFFQGPEEEPGEVGLIYWGMEEESVMRPVINAFETSHPRVNVIYNKLSLLNYRTRLQTQLAAANSASPDIFEIHGSLVSLFKEDLASVPASFMEKGEYEQTFFPLAKETLILGGKIYAVPKTTEGLALFYNEQILKGVGAEVPANWSQFMETARKVTVRDQGGQIQTAGAALGTSSNVDFWPEILGMLFFQQPEGNLEKPGNKDGAEVFQFYTSFIIDPRNKTWDTTLPPSTEMFAAGRLAFYFAPASQLEVIKAKNPNLAFKVSQVPSLAGNPVSYGSFYVVGVSSRSSKQKEAWEFIKFLYSAQTGVFTGIPARVDLAAAQVGDGYLGAFITQAPYYKTWYLNSNTSDAGINEEMVNIYKNAVDSVLAGQSPSAVLQGLEPQIQQILSKYKVK